MELPKPLRTSFDALETLLASSPAALPIALVGDHGAGKTTLARHWLARHFDHPDDHYGTLNRPILDAMKRESSLDECAASPAKARLIAKLAAADYLETHLAGKAAFVLDGIELAVSLRLPLLSMAQPFARAGSVILLCVPDAPHWNVRLERLSSECRRIELPL